MTSEPLDVRLLPPAVTVWGLTAAGLGWTLGHALGAAAVLLIAGVGLTLTPRLRRPDKRGGRLFPAIGVTALVGASALAAAGLRTGAVHAGPLADLAGQGAQVGVIAVVATDPASTDGAFGAGVRLRVSSEEVTGRGTRVMVHAPLMVLADTSWSHLRIGDRISATGRLSTAAGVDLSAVLLADADPHLIERAGWMWRSVEGVRAGLWDAVEGVPPPQQALVPALVDGDDSQVPDELQTDFMTTGLTHLLAVSGSNLTLVLSFALLLARWLGVRGRGLPAVGAVTVVFFVLLARPEPSVLRAAAMGLVGLAGLTSGTRRRGIRALCVAVLVLLLFDPWLARSVGFLLSALATAGIVVLAAPWRTVLSRWMPVWLAEMIAVPLSAQVVCTPAIAALSGQVSVVAVFANLIAAPAVGPTTVLGLVAGLVDVGCPAVGRLIGLSAGVPAWWIVTVAQRAASLSGASLDWPASPEGLVTLSIVCAGLIWLIPRLLRRPAASVAVVLLMIVLVLRPWGRLGWPPEGWLLVMCDVGQGDALVLNVGARSAVVVDAGPDPNLVDQCLDDLNVDQVPIVVLTHFHADHVDGLPGVLDGRDVGEIIVSPLAAPTSGAAAVAAWADDAEVAVGTARPGDERAVGSASWTVLGPLDGTVDGVDPSAEDGSVANNASIVIRVELEGHIFLLAGDAEPEEEGDILRAGSDLSAEVVKVSHHGSSQQDPEFYAQTGADIALISVGADNDYGHPTTQTLALLGQLDIDIFRTDTDGTVAVVERHGTLAVVTSSS
jgi:competence protein ComEC